jgi:hypothetical protein
MKINDFATAVKTNPNKPEANLSPGSGEKKQWSKTKKH